MFDLDGTLLPVGQDFFYNDYPDAAAPYFAHVTDSKTFRDALLQSTWDMVNNLNPRLPNLEAFRLSFEPKLGQDWEVLWSIFDRFYNEGFPKLQSLVPRTEIARKVVKQCLDQGWQIILATNPIFPVDAVKERMRWCMVDDLPWQFITTLEHMHFCKPHIQYYQEILDRMELEPENCVMIGNDMQEDMVASRLGIKTILVEDFCINRNCEENGIFEPDMRGKLEDVPKLVSII